MIVAFLSCRGWQGLIPHERPGLVSELGSARRPETNRVLRLTFRDIAGTLKTEPDGVMCNKRTSKANPPEKREVKMEMLARL
jgi:hypothetical protein